MVGLVKPLSCAAVSMTKDDAAISKAVVIKKHLVLFIIHFLGSLISGWRSYHTQHMNANITMMNTPFEKGEEVNFFKKQSFLQP
jgi:hypothetical protein